VSAYVVAYYHRTTGERAGWLAAKAVRGSLRTMYPHKARKLALSDAGKLAGRCNSAGSYLRAEVEAVGAAPATTPSNALAALRAMPIAGNAWQDEAVLAACHALACNTTQTLADRCAALDHMSRAVMGCDDPPADAAALAEYLAEFGL
jgi:hypothetical protein